MSSAPNTGAVPLRPALKVDGDGDRATSSSTSTTKAVQIAEPEPDVPEEAQPKRQFSAGVGKRLSGRPPIVGGSSSRSSILRQQSSLEALGSYANSSQPPLQEPQDTEKPQSQHHHLDHLGERLINQVAEWLEHERSKKEHRRARRRHSRRKPSVSEAVETGDASPSEQNTRLCRTTSIDSQASDVSLDRLQKIIDDSMSHFGLSAFSHHGHRFHPRRHSKKRATTLQRAASSDTEYHEGDVLVPSCDGVLDNSKTLSYTGGKASAADEGASISSKREEKERKAWSQFKGDVLRLTHTLRIKGWRRVPLDRGDSIEIERLSGALTNAVYVVSPPQDMETQVEPGKRPPAKLLLRVYGPQVENIIDRDNELGVLRRLARKKIGPRLLGTFENGRFEQFFNAFTLTPADLRDPDTSKKIAKRMRELHDGVDLLEEEKNDGPFVLKNWDQWLGHVEKVATELDKIILSGNTAPVRGPGDAWRQRGFVCGVEWVKFKAVFDEYREWLNAQYGGTKSLREQLVFAHNDTQYGNILRTKPDDEKSPLLHPQNEHKQLIVIDFEYAGANTRGLEFANHFTEWTYNYHDALTPHVCNTEQYPTPEEQRRFIRAYVNHRPEYPSAGTPKLRPSDGPVGTPKLRPSDGPIGTPSLSATNPGASSSIVEFMLDARVPPGGWKEDEKRREDETEKLVKDLMDETRLWRIANSGLWIAWGLMQANVSVPEEAGGHEGTTADSTPATIAPPEEEEAGEDVFDYLSYAQDRAYFFWGDCVSLGLVKLNELPEDLRARIKTVDY